MANRRWMLAVFEDERRAKQAERALSEGGIDPERIRVGDRGDRIASLRAEMDAEVNRSIAGPGTGPFTQEQTKTAGALALAGTVVGALVALPFAFLFDHAVGLLTALVISAFCGATTGATIGFVAGGGIGSRGPDKPLAAERGVTLAVEDDGRATELLSDLDAIRIDVLEDDRPQEPLATEAEGSDEGFAEDFAEKLRHPGGDWERFGDRSGRSG